MEIKKNELITIPLQGRIDSTTAQNIETQIFEKLEEGHYNAVIFDMADVVYISSAGLRVLLKVKKTINDVSAINVSASVYDVFDMTGFNKMISVKKVMREISIEGCEILGQGGHGTVYRLDPDTIIKVYGDKDPLDEIEREINYARTAFVYGIPTAIAFDVVKCGTNYGAVFELIKADTFANAINTNPDKFEEYKKKYIDLIDTLHATEVDTSQFESIKDLYHKWIDDTSEIYKENERDILHRIVNSIPDKKTLVHGDIHPKNVMMQDGELVLIDMADVTYGHQIFDFAGMGLTHWIMATRTPERAPSIIGIEADKASDLWNAVLSNTFENLSEQEQKKKQKIVENFTMLKYTLAIAINKNMPIEMRLSLADHARKDFFPTAEELIGAIR